MFCCNASEAYLTPNSASTISQASSPLSRFRFKTLIPSNETKLSDGHRGRASLELKGFNHAKRKREASGRSPSA